MEKGVKIVPSIFVDQGMHVNVAEILAQKDWKQGMIKTYDGTTETLFYDKSTDSIE